MNANPVPVSFTATVSIAADLGRLAAVLVAQVYETIQPEQISL